ncbi:glycosyltransferase [Chelatococcus asaccharovorans]|uniref:glycosyltransferase n=1 Tax=Chelatococcus asaccharovorans TaxID=28210 RepID=UPI00224C6554|nr:glycosyltransferase [Chelatococcus asaccharovorans]CAH1668150.1 Poly(Glycerol-phosphate) alpha-glucosyltransferase [Chelatococcus asaccharovorans]CAH1680344.1 Poly(Glycerol-phosphate) alpha-glucosyltransferase [Chelatococcus asaccharovorans]
MSASSIDIGSIVSPAHATPLSAPAALKVGMLLGSIAPTAGGVAACVQALGLALHARPMSHRVEVFSLAGGDGSRRLGGWGALPVTLSQTRGPRSFGYAPGLSAAMATADLDVLHVHGLWMYPSVAARRWGAARHAPYIVSPHGMLDPWALANSGWKKEIAARLYERAHLTEAACIHALCGAELAAIRAFGLRNPVCVIRNGVTAPTRGVADRPLWRASLPADARILLFLGRLTPKKGLTNLIRAWSAFRQRAGTRASAWHLVIAGWGADGYVAGLRSLTADLGLGSSVHFIGPQHDAAKDATFDASDAFILPSVSEGLPMAILEAWQHGLPVLMTPQCNLPEGIAHGAGIAVMPDIDSLTAGLADLASWPPSRLAAMGHAGRALVAAHFSWPAVAEDFSAVYEWICRGGVRPGCVDIW